MSDTVVISEEIRTIEDLISRIAARTLALTEAIGEVRHALEAGELELTHWQSYRLAVVLMRVDEAAAGLVMDAAKRSEARADGVVPGQLPAFEE